jgi:hypothetical protein
MDLSLGPVWGSLAERACALVLFVGGLFLVLYEVGAVFDDSLPVLPDYVELLVTGVVFFSLGLLVRFRA